MKSLPGGIMLIICQQKIAKGIGILIKARSCLNRETLVSLYYTVIYPYLTNCNSVWVYSFLYNLNRLHLLQKKLLELFRK